MGPWRGVRGTQLAGDLERLAGEICAHRFPILGYGGGKPGRKFDGGRDSVHQVESGLSYFRRIPYLNAALAGDHKVIWGTQPPSASGSTGPGVAADRAGGIPCGNPSATPKLVGSETRCARNQLVERAGGCVPRSFVDLGIPSGRAKPSRGGHRASAERVVPSWRFTWSTTSRSTSRPTRTCWARLLFCMRWACCSRIGRAPRDGSRGAAGVVAEEMIKQVRADGSHFEQSSAYHVYATDLFPVSCCAGTARRDLS